MSVSLYRYTEACDGQPCVRDCDKCNFNLMSDDRSCPNCYYVDFDMDAYPCSRCIRNAPTDDKFQPKPNTEELRRDVRWP